MVETHRLRKHFGIHVVAVLGVLVVHDLQDPPTDSPLSDQSGSSRRGSSLSVSPKIVPVPPKCVGDIETWEKPNPISVFPDTPLIIIFSHLGWRLGTPRPHSLHSDRSPNVVRILISNHFSKVGVEITMVRWDINSPSTLPDTLARLIPSKV